MLIVTGVFDLEMDHVARLKDAAIEMAQATRDEPGCRAYAFWQDIENPARFRVYEEWDNRERLQAHFETPHMQVWRDALKAGGLLSRDVVTVEGGTVQAL
ncbi:MAG: putative quinol monooxygenase [Paracoccaceae bacterium]